MKARSEARYGRGLRWVGLALMVACGGLSPQEAPAGSAGDAREAAEALALEAHPAWEGPGGDELGVGRKGLQFQPLAIGTASVASDGELFLAVWRDERSGNIFGTRVSQEGAVLDPGGLALNPSGRGAFERGGPVAVAFNGTDFLVVWRGDPDVVGVRVRRDGTVLDPEGFRITRADSSGDPSVACNDTGRCLVVVLDIGDDDDNSVIGGLVQDGTPLPPTRLRVARGQLASPRVAWTGTRFLVVWDEARGESRDVFGARVTTEGAVLDVPGFPISAASGEQRTPAVARAGDVSWVVWEDTRRGQSDIFGARVREDGTVLEPDAIPISTASKAQTGPRVASVGDKSFVLWTDERGRGHSRIRGARVAADGGVINRAGFPVYEWTSGRLEHPDVACGATQCLTVFESPLAFPPYNVPVGRFVLGTRLTMRRGAQDRPALELSTAAPAQHFPAVAWGEDTGLLVWQEFRDTRGPTIVAARVRRDGTVLDAEGLPLPSAPGASHPAVAFDGSVFLVVWQEPHAEGEDIRGARVGTSGRVLDGASIPISTAPVRQISPSVAGGGGRFLVAWEDTRDSELFDLRFTPFAARVSGSGVVLDGAGLRLAPPERFGLDPDVVYMGRDFLVAWTGIGIEGTRVASASGAVLDPAGLALSPPSFLFEGSPALSFDGTTALVVWAKFGDIVGSRVAADGTLVGPAGFTITDAPEEQGLPDVSFDGTHHRVAWLDSRGPSSATNPLSIHGARVATDGTVLEPGGVPLLPEVFTDFPNTAPPAVAGDGRGGAVLVHTRFIAETRVHNSRLVGRRLAE